MDTYTLIELCKAYAGLGWAVQAQLNDVLDGADLNDLNGNALKMIEGFLRRSANEGVEEAGDFADQIEEHLAK